VQGFNPDPYQVLGIARDATQREVKQAYRKLAMKFHPDHNPVNPDAEARFRQIQQAYETLSNRRKQGQISPAAFCQRNYTPSPFKNEHPFFSFYWTMRANSDEIMKNMKSNRSGEK
jgi:curved DNA-binding protein CbpA